MLTWWKSPKLTCNIPSVRSNSFTSGLSIYTAMALGPVNFLGMEFLRTHALGGQWIPVALNALMQLLQAAPPLPPTSSEHTKQYHIDPMATKAVTALLKDL